MSTDRTDQEKLALASLNTAGKRVRVHDAQMVVKVPKPVKNLVAETAADESVSEATIVRWALADFFEKRGIAAGE